MLKRDISFEPKYVKVRDVVKKIGETKGNIYLRITNALFINEYYNYVVAFTVFTSTLKFSKMIAFHKAFMQIAASLKLCFQGLSTFVVEFAIVFIAFSSFFYFVLKNDLENFRDEAHTLEYTLAMSIGKFNFSALRQADELAAWIFFVFSSKLILITLDFFSLFLVSRKKRKLKCLFVAHENFCQMSTRYHKTTWSHGYPCQFGGKFPCFHFIFHSYLL